MQKLSFSPLEQFAKLPAFDQMDPRELRQELFDLSRFQRFLDRVGNPERGLPVVHVAGSKGKGSTVALIASALQALGKRVGVFMSPYLQEPRESIFVDGVPMSSADFSGFMQRYEPFFSKMSITSFELLTAMALQHFHDCDVDFVVLETGLGGRLDATNVIESALLSVITPIEKEHTELLGNSITSIAYEKLGIVRSETPVILAPQQDPFVLDFAKNVCMQKNAPTLSVQARYEASINHRSFEAYTFRLKTPSREIRSIALGLLGDHQVTNAMTAWACLDALLPDFDVEAVKDVWTHLHLPGRFEIQQLGQRQVILDGAHTVTSAKALRKTIDQLVGAKPLLFLVAFLSDKDVEGVLNALLRPGDTVMVTQVHHPRALPAREVEARLGNYFAAHRIRCILTNTLSVALQKAPKINAHSPLCLTGSFKLVAEVLQNPLPQTGPAAARQGAQATSPSF